MPNQHREWRLITNEMPDEGETVDLWCAPPPRMLSSGPCRVADCWFSNGKWWRHADPPFGDGVLFHEVHNATHWCPVPDGPTKEAEASETVSNGWQPIETAPRDTVQDDFLIANFNSRGDCCWVNIVRNPKNHHGMTIATHWARMFYPVPATDEQPDG